MRIIQQMQYQELLMFELEHPIAFLKVSKNKKKPIHVEELNKNTIGMVMSIFILSSINIF